MNTKRSFDETINNPKYNQGIGLENFINKKLKAFRESIENSTSQEEDDIGFVKVNRHGTEGIYRWT